ncbi:MAG: hypothetical protein HQ513_07955, partial [Rhodospirillales bacterium]|nr:hypothetical protein [Rhodospirillales bacterium]
GYRHCFAIIEGRGGWVVYNPLSHYTEIETYQSLGINEIAQFYRRLGHVVVQTRVQKAPQQVVPMAPYTCVEAVKRVLGIQARAVVTPWHLYRRIEKIHKKANNSLTMPTS